MSKDNKSAGSFDLNRDGKLSMTEHYIAYKTFEQMSKPSSYTPRPRKNRWWNEPIHHSPLGEVICSFFLLVAFQAPFVAGQVYLFEEVRKKQEYTRYLLYTCGYAHTDNGLYFVIAIVALIQLALLCLMGYGCIGIVKDYCKYRQSKKRKRQAEEYPEE